MFKVFVFGNEDWPGDQASLQAAARLKEIDGIEFVTIKPNEDLSFIEGEKVVLMDVVSGIDEVMILNENSLDRLVINRGVTAHDFDLGLQLKLLKKMGKLQKVTIIGLPQNQKPDYDRIQSILRKLVEQDIQGS